MTGTLKGMMSKEAKKTATSAEAERRCVSWSRPRARGEHLTGPDGLLIPITKQCSSLLWKRR